jgi:hypothetical protein
MQWNSCILHCLFKAVVASLAQSLIRTERSCIARHSEENTPERPAIPLGEVSDRRSGARTQA